MTLLTIPQAAKRLGVSRDTIYIWIRKGTIKAERLLTNNRMRIPASEIARLKGATVAA